MPRTRPEGDQDQVDQDSPFAGADGTIAADPADAPVAKGEHCPTGGKFPHATRAGYKRGCRGLECTKANTDSKRGQRQRSSGRRAGTSRSSTTPSGGAPDTSLVPALTDIIEMAGGGLSKYDPLPGAVLAVQAGPEAESIAPWVAKNPALKRGVLALHGLMTGGAGGGAWLPFLGAVALSHGMVDPDTFVGVLSRKMVDATGVEGVDEMLELVELRRQERQAQAQAQDQAAHDADAVYLGPDGTPEEPPADGWRPGGLLQRLAARDG